MTRFNILEAIAYNKLILVLGPVAIIIVFTEIKYLIMSFIKKKDIGESLLLKLYMCIRVNF